MIMEQLEKQDHFTNTEKQLAEYILAHVTEIPELSARKLGSQSYTSKASVIRFCQKLQFSGYEEFREKLALEVAERARIALLLAQEPVSKETSLNELLHIVPTIYTNTLNTVNLGINDISFKRIISQIRKASTVDIYGIGITYTCAMTAKFKLQSLGINCNTYTGINEHYIRSTRKERNRVAIVLSFTGTNNAMTEIAQYLKVSGVFVIGIGGNESAVLQQYCDEYIEFTAQQLILSMEVMAPFIAITYVFDLLFTALLVADFENNVDAALDVIHFRKEILD